MKKCLIYLDENNLENSIDLLEVANQVYVEDDYETYGLVINQSSNEAYGYFDHLILVNDSKLAQFNMIAITKIIEDLYSQYEFDCILFPATYFGRMLAPRVAIRLQTGLVADVTAIYHNDSGLEMVRPAFSGNIMAGISKIGQGPIMMSVRQNVFKYDGLKNIHTKIISYKGYCEIKDGIKLIDEKEKPKTFEIRKSKVLIAGGGGVMRHFEKLDLLAKEMNGQVSASRRLVDKRIAPRSIQVGQSGKTVSPKLYVALGIYGSVQHIEGLRNVEHIISVNTNKNAAICSLSDIVVEGDAIEFINKLIDRINKSKKDYE